MLLNELTKNDGRLSDFIRFLTLFLYGGVYCDMDCYSVLGMEKWPRYPFENSGIIFSTEAYFTEQYFIITQPGHPLVG
jgi:mannosyltransferase OCH1-like enzyme